MPRHFLYYFRKDIRNLAIIFVVGVLAYWPVSFHIFSLKNDALNYFLPVRVQISEAISNGLYPFWSPYINLGYPMHADMQSGAWNVFVWLFSIFGPYTLYTMQTETVLYVLLAGAGMYWMLRQLKINNNINLLVSVAYMLSGFVIDSSQHINWIASAAFLPFTILFFLRILEQKKISSSIFAGLFFYLLLTCGYPAYFILTAYLCAALVIWHFIHGRNGSSLKSEAKRAVLPLTIMVLVFLVLSAPAILSYWQFLGLASRGKGAGYAGAMSNPYHPSFFISYLFPLPVFKASFGDVTDPLARNSYFGIVGLIFLIVGLFTKTKDQWIRFCKAGLIVSVLFSLGEWGVVRIVAYYLMPLMDSFRHPSGARLFVIFFACNISAHALNTLQKEGTEKLSAMMNRVFKVCLFIFAGVFVFSNIQIFTGSGFSRLQQWQVSQGGFAIRFKTILESLNFTDILLFNILLQLPFLYLIYRNGVGRWRPNALVITGIVNTALMAMLLMPFTVVKKDRARVIQEKIAKNFVRGYPAPDLSVSIEKNSEDGLSLFNEIGPLNLYNKKIGRTDYFFTPSNLLSHNEFWNDGQLRNKVMNQPFIYKAGLVELSKDQYAVNIQKYSPNHIVFSINSSDPASYVLTQNHYPTWTLRIDSIEKSPSLVNGSFMGFSLSAGKHVVEFEYRPTIIIIALWISLSVLLIIIGLFISKISRARRIL